MRLEGLPVLALHSGHSLVNLIVVGKNIVTRDELLLGVRVGDLRTCVKEWWRLQILLVAGGATSVQSLGRYLGLSGGLMGRWSC